VMFGQFIPQSAAEFMFGLSLSIKSFIIFLLPAIIFCLLFKAASKLSKDASKVIALIFGGVIISNFVTTSFSQFIGQIVYSFDMELSIPAENTELKASSLFLFPSIIPNYIAMFSGIIAGVVFTTTMPDKSQQIANILEKFVNQLLKVITFVIPIFVAGFIIKLQHDGVINKIIQDYASIFAIIALVQYGYIFCLYFVLSNFSLQRFYASVRNMIPATVSAFSTMSSAASMPLTLIAAEKNCSNKDVANTVIPATVNIHLIGDCVAIPCFAYAVLKNYAMPEPMLISYFVFSLYFVLAKFSVAAIPGGGIIVMLPILEQYLGFNSEMLSLITALYILFDPIITSANVMGNGAFAKAIDKFYK
jgi:Na+/H+-dicarboxylate symporter